VTASKGVHMEGRFSWITGNLANAASASMPGPGESTPREPRLLRSNESLAFQDMWERLPRNGPIPERRAFKPRAAKAFLSDLIVVQAPSPLDMTLRIRLVGDAVRQNVQGNIVGYDFLDFMQGEERKTRALGLVREMFERPCGQWWVAPVHYERGFSHYWEVTAFPLAADYKIPATIVGLVRPFDTLFDMQERRTAVRVDAAVRFEPIALHRQDEPPS